MVLNIPNTPYGALIFGIAAFILALASTTLIALILEAFPHLKRLWSRPAAKIVHPQPAMPAYEQEISDDYHIAAISAAIAMIMGPHRIVHIEPGHHGVGWQTEGRAAHHGSHVFSHPGASQRQPDNHIGNSHGTEVQNHGRRPAI